MSITNQKQIFSDLLSVDAWHDELTDSTPTSDLHTDVTFFEARIGAEKESTVLFKLRLRRAKVSVITPEHEPVKVIKKTVNRGTSQPKVTRTTTSEKTTELDAKGTASLAANPLSVNAKCSADASAKANQINKIEETSEETLAFEIIQMTNGNSYCWHVSPKCSDTLHGKPWAPEEPRLTLKDTRSDPSKGIPPTVRVEVACRREDLEITDIRLKDESKWKELLKKRGFNNKIAAAESYIKDQLVKNGLEANEIDNEFSELLLASVIADQE